MEFLGNLRLCDYEYVLIGIEVCKYWPHHSDLCGFSMVPGTKHCIVVTSIT